MADAPPADWLEEVNRLATVAAQLSTVAHETNNLLQIITGSAHMLEMAPGDAAATLRRAEVIREHAEKAAALLAGILDFARDESRSVAAIDLAALVDRVLRLRKYALAKRGVAVRVDCEHPLPQALANPRRTLQILLNVIMNAERAMHESPHPELTIRVRRDGETLAVSVRDNGPGFVRRPAADRFTVVLEPRDVPRLGLGLHVAEWLATMQEGRLEVVSSAQGTTATLRLAAIAP